MNKKQLIILGGTLLLLAVSLYLLTHIGSKMSDPTQAIPSNAALVIQLENLGDQITNLQSDSSWPHLAGTAIVGNILDRINTLDSTFTGDSLYHRWLLNSSCWITMVRAGRSGMEPVFYFSLKGQPSLNMRNILEAGQRHVRSHTYQGVELLEWEASPDNNWSCSITEGLLIVSPHGFSVESAIRLLKEGGDALADEEDFKILNSQINESDDIRIFLNPKTIGDFLSIWLNNRLQVPLGVFENVTGWMAMDVSIAEKTLLFNGLGYQNSKWLAGLSPVVDYTYPRAILTSNTAFYLDVSSNNWPSILEDNTGIYAEYFAPWATGQMVYAINEPFSPEFYDQQIFAIKAADTLIARNMLAALSAHQLNVVESIPEVHGGCEIYGIPDFGQISNSLPIIGWTDHVVATMINGWLIFTPSVSTLETHIEKINQGLTLASESDYTGIRGELSTQALLTLWFNGQNGQKILEAINGSEKSTDLQEIFMNISPFLLQFTPYQEDTYLITALLQLDNNSTTNGPELLWKAPLDTSSSHPPVFVKNHESGQMELLLFDDGGTAYLFSNSGSLLWQRKLESKPVGEIAQVDFYNNGKLQYLFSTSSSIQLIDRNGEDVAGFPIRLPADNISGLSLVKYNDQKDYRMFVGCANGSIYGYRKAGEPLPGWNPRRKTGVIQVPLRHYEWAGKDYLITHTEAGTLLIFDRKGEYRLKPIPLDAAFLAPFAGRQAEKGYRLYNFSSDGRFFMIDDKGNTMKDSLLDFSGAVTMVPLYRPDGDWDYLVWDERQLYVLDQQLKVLANMELPAVRSNVFVLAGNAEYPVGISTGTQVYQYSRQLVRADPFPLPGSGEFILADFYRNGEPVMAVPGNGYTVDVFRLR